MRIEGNTHIGEAARWAGKACGRLNGYPWTSIAGVLIGAFAVAPAIVVATVATRMLEAPGWTYLPFLIGLAFPLAILAGRWARGLMVGHFRKQLMARGVSNPLPWSLEITDDAIRWLIGDIESRAPVSAVSDVFPVGPYWVMLIQGTPVFIAKRNFPDEAAQRAFLSDLLPRMTAAARGRSAKAARFASA